MQSIKQTNEQTNNNSVPNNLSCCDYVPDRKQLAGLSLQVAELFGKPHLGCAYRRDDVDSHSLTTERCVICGNVATNCHHVPPKGMGGRNRQFTLSTEWGQFVLKPALFALCGSGTTGCHNDFHGGARYVPKWVWDVPGAGKEWWNGWLLSHGFEPHSRQLFDLGHWEIFDRETEKTLWFVK